MLGILFASSIISCKIESESSDKLSNETSSELSSSESSSETSSEPSSESSSEESESSSEEYETNSESSSEIEGTSITITFDTDGGNEIKEMAVFKDKFVNLPTPTRGNDVFLGWEFENKLYNINPLVYGKSEHPRIYAWKLEHVIKYNKRISCKGKLGLWNLDINN